MGIKKTIAAAFFIGLAGLSSACSDDAAATTATIDGNGMTPVALTVIAGDQIDYVNVDSRSHQIFSPDCSELSSSSIAAGDTASVRAGAGPKTCHIQDRTSPEQFHATVDVLPTYGNPSDNG